MSPGKKNKEGKIIRNIQTISKEETKKIVKKSREETEKERNEVL